MKKIKETEISCISAGSFWGIVVEGVIGGMGFLGAAFELGVAMRRMYESCNCTCSQ